MNGEILRYLTWLAERERSAHTLAAYRNDLGQLLDFLVERWGDERGWGRVDAGALVAFQDELRRRDRASATLARKTAAVRSFFQWLHAQRLVSVDPTTRLSTSKAAWAAPTTLAPDALAALLAQPRRRRDVRARTRGKPLESRGDTAEDLRDDAMLRLLAGTGMRVSELVALDVDDLDLASDYVRVIRVAGRERYIPFDPSVRASLAAYRDEARPALTHHAAAPALFVNHRGERLTRQGFWFVLKGYARAAGLPAITPHTLRHSFAAHLLSNHANIRDAQELLGHANVKTTQLYQKAIAEERAAASRRVA